MKKIIILIFILFIYIVSGCSIPDFIEKPTEDNPTEHTCVYDKQVIEEEYLSIPATCTSKAKYYYSCSCGKKGYNTFLYGEVALHTWGEKVLKEESKYNEEDGKYYNIYSSSCEVCLAEKKEKVEVTKEDFKYKLTISFDITNGSVRTEKSSYLAGSEVVIDVRPNRGYLLDKIYINNKEIESNTFIMPNEDITILVTFIKEVEDESTEKDEPTLDDTPTNDTEIKCEHTYIDNVCSKCGSVRENSLLYELFGSDIDIYTNDEENPYNVDLNVYGSDIYAYFYEPNLSILTDPYTNINQEDFYKNYQPATSYEDAYFRTKHYLMSGDITEQYYKPTEGKITEGENAIKLSTATYILNTDGSYLGYVVNVLDGDDYVIYYGGGYSSLNDVAAYLLAFGEVPKNTNSNKGSSGQKTVISQWGKYGRVNDSNFSGDTSSYPYEPELPKILGANKILYHEMDFGTTGGYTNSNSNGTKYTQTLYNTGSKISRGAARMVFVADKNVKSIDERHVFYTYNHYNDFQEYLNYYNGWGIRFGNESAGNEYCGNSSDYYALKCIPPTKYPEVLLKKYSEIN